MDFISNYWLAIVLRFPLGVIACILAKKAHRTPWLWFVNCFFADIILSIIFLLVSATLVGVKDKDSKDKAGWVCFAIMLVVGALTALIKYMASKV